MKNIVVCGSGAHAVCVIASFEEAARHGLIKIVWITTTARVATLHEFSWVQTRSVALNPQSCTLRVAQHVAGRIDHAGVNAQGHKYVACAGQSIPYDALVFALDPTEDLLGNDFFAMYGSPLPAPDRLANKSSAVFNLYSPFAMQELSAFLADLKPRDYLRASVGESATGKTVNTEKDSDEEDDDDDDDVELPRPVCVDFVLPATRSKMSERLCVSSKLNDPQLLHFAAHDTERHLELKGKMFDDCEVQRIFTALGETYLQQDASSAIFLRDVKSVTVSESSATDISPIVRTMFLTSSGVPVSSWLRALTIEHTTLGVAQIELLCTSFSETSSVEELVLADIGMNSGCAVIVAGAMKRLRHCLRSVDLSTNDFGSEGVSLLMQTIPLCSLMRSVRLSGVDADDACATHVSSCLPLLESLDLSSNRFGDELALQIGEAIRKESSCCRLRSLSLENNVSLSAAGVFFVLKCVVATATPLSSLRLRGCGPIGVSESAFAASFLAQKQTSSFSCSTIKAEAKCLEVFLAAIKPHLVQLDIDLVVTLSSDGRYDQSVRQAPRQDSSATEIIIQINELIKRNRSSSMREDPAQVAARTNPLHLLHAAGAAAASLARKDLSCVVLRVIDNQEEVFAGQENFYEHEEHRAALFESLVADVSCPNVIFRCGSKGRPTLDNLRHFCDATVTALQSNALPAVRRLSTLPWIHNLPQVDDRYYLNEKLAAFMIGPGCSSKHTDVMSTFSAVSGSLSFFAMHLMPQLVTEVLKKLCPLQSLKPLLHSPEKLGGLRHHDFRMAREQLAVILSLNSSSEEDLRQYVQRHRLPEVIEKVLERVRSLSPPVYEDVIQAQRRYHVSALEREGATQAAKPSEPSKAEKASKKKDAESGAVGSATIVPLPEAPLVDSWTVIAQVLREHCV